MANIIRSKEYILTPAEIDILEMGTEDPDYVTGYFLKPLDGDGEGFIFDYNFTPNGAWQKKVHRAKQSNITVIGGVGTGKTLGIGMSACVWSLTTESFKFLNVAQKEWQAKLMYDLILERAEGTPLEKIIYSAPQRPYPKIVLRYRIGKVVNQSTMEFMSVDRDARGIFSWRGDWINVEEAGLLDNLDEIALNLSTRLNGSTKRNRPFLGRFSFISNPWDTPHLWYLFDLASASPEENLSIVISTYDNHNVTETQIRDMLKHIPEDERPRFLEGIRPEGKGSYFSKESIYQCEDIAQAELIENAAQTEKPGFILRSMGTPGVYHMETPRLTGRVYFMLGDPGSGNAPGRNAPVLMIWDVTDFPSSAMRLVAFWWGSGDSQITPFINMLMDWRDKYSPMFIGIDSTGPQKSMAELLNIHYNEEDLGITGLDFSGPRKASYLVASRLIIENRLARWPKNIIGIRAQLANYDPSKDKAGMPKIPQDIVAAFSMAAFAVRSHFGVTFEELFGTPFTEASEFSERSSRETRLSDTERTRRVPAREAALG